MPQRHGQHGRRDAALTAGQKGNQPSAWTRLDDNDATKYALLSPLFLQCSDCVLRVASDKSYKQPGARGCA